MSSREPSDPPSSGVRMGVLAAAFALAVAGLGVAASDSVGHVVSATWEASGAIGAR